MLGVDVNYGQVGPLINSTDVLRIYGLISQAKRLNSILAFMYYYL